MNGEDNIRRDGVRKMISYKQMSRECLLQYDCIPMKLTVKSMLKIEKENRGLGGFRFVETAVEPYVRDFSEGESDNASRWARDFDVSNWAYCGCA